MSTVAIEKFLQTAYSDEKLAALLAHAEDGKLEFMSCCCFIGVATAEHTLRTDLPLISSEDEHYRIAVELPGAKSAECEYCRLVNKGDVRDFDVQRRENLIPLIKAEIARRDALKETHCPCGDTCDICDPESALEAQNQAEECSDMNTFHRY